jgi:quercetin dioxygenase-like cupin family protein
MSTTPETGSDRRSILAALLAAVPALAASRAAAEASSSPDDQWVYAFGLKLKVEITTASTGGVMSSTRVVSPPGGGPPAHIHTREDELFIILRGHYRFWQKDMPTIEAPAGSFVYLHKGMIHQYRNVSDNEGEHVLICLPGGLEELFIAVSKEKLTVPRDMDRIKQLSGEYGITYMPKLAD